MAAAADAAQPAAERWPALESNPEVMTAFAKKLTGDAKVEVADVFGLDEELLVMVPQPCYALIVCFPSSSVPKAERGADFGAVPAAEVAEGAFYMKQVSALTNACGTVALVHALANQPAGVLPADSPLGRFVAAHKDSSFQERGDALDASDELNKLHLGFAHQGQTAVLESSAVQHHYMALTTVDGELVELDGAYKQAPRKHGKISEKGFLSDAAAYVRDKVVAGREDMTFSLVALCGSE